MHDHRQRFVVLALELVEKNTAGALILDEQAGRVQILDHLGQIVVVGALAAHVGAGQGDIEAVVDPLAMSQGNLQELVPELIAVGVAGLEFDHQSPGAIGEFRGGVETPLGFAIEAFQVGQLHADFTACPAFLFHVGQQHAELGAPVADVIVANDPVTEKFQGPRDGVADDGRTQMADVHLLGEVGRGIIHHHGSRRGLRGDRQAGIGQGGGDPAGQPVGIEIKIDETGTGDFHLAHQL